MSHNDLDELLGKLEKECNMQPSSSSGVSPRHLLPFEAQTGHHISKRITSTETFAEETFYNHKPVAVSTPQSKGMVSTAVSQNLSELDNLLQDLSNAKLSQAPFNGNIPYVESRSNMIEQRQEVREETIIVQSKVIEEGGRWELQSPVKRWGSSDSIDRFNPPTPPMRQVSSVFKKSETNFGGASSATQELDDLMTSLNSFRMRDGGIPATDTPVNTILDDMLGNLQEEMDKQGIKTTPKGVCHACEKPIVGQIITALGKTFHPEHFVCEHCNQELGSQNFFERNGKPFCEEDYHTLFSPRCAGCNGPILDKCISALDKTWHPEHFVCSECDGPFGEDGFHEKDNRAYCKRCYYAAFAPKCAGCQLPIIEGYISSLNGQWHPGCFVCAKCHAPFPDGNFFEVDGKPYCENDFHALRGSLCAGCQKPISGRCITAMFRKFHPEHFVCSFCLKQLNKGTFKEQGEKPYCHECYDRLFG